jgi:xanthosine utilization system XapX-like protein
MVTTPPATPQHGSLPHRLAIPAAMLLAFGIIALLWASGLQSIALTVFRVLGLEPGPIPFLDTHTLLAAAECQRLGVDVYRPSSCMLGLVHVYSPLWLVLIPPALGAAAAAWVGAALDLMFILALPLLIRGSSRREIGVMAIAVFSPMTVYALERGNNDLVIFLLLLCAGLIPARSRCGRISSYAVIVGAALLKFYPGVTLALIARERQRDAVLVAAGAAAALGLMVAYYHVEVGQALSNIPNGAYAADSFSAKNLPFAVTQVLLQLRSPAPVAIALLGILTVFALARTLHTASLLDTLGIDWTTSEMRFAAIGSVLLTACFFAGQNVNYRGIYFLFVLPGLMRLHGATQSAEGKQFLSRMVAAVLFVMWGDFFRLGLQHAAALSGEALGDRLAVIIWVLRELVWWWLIAGLAAIAICYVAQLPLLRDDAAWPGRAWRAFERRLRRLLRVDPAADS